MIIDIRPIITRVLRMVTTFITHLRPMVPRMMGIATTKIIHLSHMTSIILRMVSVAIFTLKLSGFLVQDVIPIAFSFSVVTISFVIMFIKVVLLGAGARL